MGKCEMSRKYTIYYTSATSATPKNDNFCSFSRSQNDVETDRRPSGSKMVPKCCPRASRAGPEPKIDSKRVPKGVPRGCQNDPEIAFWKVLGHRCDAKGLQGVSGHPPRLKMQPKLSQNGTNNDTKTLLCFREPSKLGAYVPQGPPVTQGGLQRHTATTSRGRNSPLATWIRRGSVRAIAGVLGDIHSKITFEESYKSIN